MITYKATYDFSLSDLFDASETDLIFTVRAMPSPDWWALVRLWLDDGGEDVGRAEEIIAKVFVRVSQGDSSMSLNTRDNVIKFRDELESQNPGFADDIIIRLALGHYTLHLKRIEDKLGNSSKPLTQRVNGEKIAV